MLERFITKYKKKKNTMNKEDIKKALMGTFWTFEKSGYSQEEFAQKVVNLLPWDKQDELIEQNAHLKEMLATLSKTHSKDMNRLSKMIDDFIRDKRQIGKDLGLNEHDQMICHFQRRAIFDLQFKIKEANRVLTTDAPSYEQLNQLQAIFQPTKTSYNKK